MIKKIIKMLKFTINNFDKKILKILKYGFKFCLLIASLSAIILVTYLFFVHSNFLYQIGLAIFQLSICFVAEFIASAITIDAISKQIG